MIIPKSSNGHGFHGAFDVAIFGGPVEPALAEATSTFDDTENHPCLDPGTPKFSMVLEYLPTFTPKMAQM